MRSFQTIVSARLPFALAVVALCTVADSAAAQKSAAPQSAVPLLAPIPATGGVCHSIAESPSSKRLGSVRSAMFDLAAPDRSVSVSVDANNRPVYFSARASAPGAAETENILVFFEKDGKVRSGERRYRATSMAPNSAGERKAVLTKADTALVQRLAASVIARCMR